MSEQLTDEEQVEALKKWWKENGTAIIVGILIGISAIVGFWKWNEYTETQAKAASLLYDNFVMALSDEKADVTNSYDSLRKDYEGTSYAALAALRMAAADYEKGETDNAITHLQWATEHPGHESIQHIARIRLSELYVAEDKLDEAEALLKGVTEPAFDAQYQAVRGDLYNKRGNTDKARAAYQLALTSSSFSGKQREFVQMKLDDLGGAPESEKAGEDK